MIVGRKIFSSRHTTIKETFIESGKNIKIGFPLMVSSLMSLLILGTSKQIIEIKWGIETFSFISLSLALMNLILVFVNKSGMVLFPSIRTLTREDQKKWYKNVLEILNIMLPITLLGFWPISVIIECWLPKYISATFFLGMLLPIVLFETKMSILGTTFLKVLNKQKSLLIINIVAFLINLFLSIVSAFYFEDLTFITLSIVLTLAVRSIITEIVVNRKLSYNINIKSVVLFGMSVIFIVLNQFFSPFQNFLIMLLLVAIYCLLNIKVLKNAVIEIKQVNKFNIEI